MTEVNLKNVQWERSSQENKEDGFHGPKIEQRVIQRDYRPKRGESVARNEKQGDDVGHPLLHNLALHLDQERREVLSKVKRSKGEYLLVHLHRLLISQALRVRKKTKRFHIVSNED